MINFVKESQDIHSNPFVVFVSFLTPFLRKEMRGNAYTLLVLVSCSFLFVMYAMYDSGTNSKTLRVVTPKSDLVCLYYNRTAFSSCPIVAVVLPVTSKGNKIDENNPDPSQLLLMNYFYPSFLSTIEPSLYEYRIYIGYAYDDPYLANSTFLSKLQQQMYNDTMSVYILFIILIVKLCSSWIYTIS